MSPTRVRASDLQLGAVFFWADHRAEVVGIEAATGQSKRAGRWFSCSVPTVLWNDGNHRIHYFDDEWVYVKTCPCAHGCSECGDYHDVLAQSPESCCRYPGCKMAAISDGRCLGYTHSGLSARVAARATPAQPKRRSSGSLESIGESYRRALARRRAEVS